VTLLDRARVTVGVVRDTLGATLALPCLVPLLAFVALRVALVAVHFAWFREPMASLFHPLLVRLYGEPATHFPNDVPAIMAMLTVANLAADVLVGPLVQGALVVAYTAVFLRGVAPAAAETWGASASRFPRLLLVALLSSALLFAGGAAFRWMASALGGAWPLGRVETEEASFLFAGLFALPLLYAPVAILLRGARVPAAIATSLRLLRERPLETAALVLPLTAVFLPAGWVFERSDAVVEAFSRTAVAMLALFEALLSAFVLSLMTGFATRLFLYQRSVS
jgi:hypothetical protein